MPNVHISAKPLVSSSKPYPPSVSASPGALRTAKRSVSSQVAQAFEYAAVDLQNIKSSLDDIHTALRQDTSAVQQVYVTDNQGRVIAAIGDFDYQGVITANYFSEIHVGDPLNTGNPAQALFNAAGNRVTVGQNGIIEVLGPFGSDAAWVGAQADTLPVSGAANNGAGLIRLTVVGHTLATGDSVPVMLVGGVPNATGIFTVTVIDANTIDLQKSVFVGVYAGGGTVNRVLHITGAANNGSGSIRIRTAVPHTYITGDEVNVQNINGVPGATGQWVISVSDSTHFDLNGSGFFGAYISGGICLRYFAGILAQTIAIGPSFPDYKLRAFADGSLRIKNAQIVSNTGGVTTTIGNETVGVIGVVGLEIQDQLTFDAFVATPTFLALYNTDPTNNLTAIAVARNGTAGILRVNNGTGAGGIDTFGAQVIADGLNGNVQAWGTVTSRLGYVFGSTSGITTNARSMVTGISTSPVGVFGTPAAGQFNSDVVTGITLISSHFGGGILTT